MQLDTAIEQRKREINDVSNDIGNEKDQNDQYGQNMREQDLTLLNKQIEKAAVIFQNQKFKTMGDRYNEIATNRFQPQMQDDQAGAILEQERQRNQVIEQVINNARQQNPHMEEILNKLVDGW